MKYFENSKYLHIHTPLIAVKEKKIQGHQLHFPRAVGG